MGFAKNINTVKIFEYEYESSKVYGTQMTQNIDDDVYGAGTMNERTVYFA